MLKVATNLNLFTFQKIQCKCLIWSLPSTWLLKDHPLLAIELFWCYYEEVRSWSDLFFLFFTLFFNVAFLHGLFKLSLLFNSFVVCACCWGRQGDEEATWTSYGLFPCLPRIHRMVGIHSPAWLLIPRSWCRLLSSYRMLPLLGQESPSPRSCSQVDHPCFLCVDLTRHPTC